MKKLILSGLIFLCLFFCTFSVNSEEKSENLAFKYFGFPFYESPFNPHTTLQLWTILKAFPMTPDIFYVVVGNPKIDWSKSKDYDEKKLKDLNTEIYTVHYGFFVETDDEKGVNITLFIYVWKNQKTGKTYKCSADVDTMTYKIKEVKSSNDNEKDIKRFIKEFNNLQIAWY